MERVERRGSIARAFGRIRTAMKRRRPADTRDARNDILVNEVAARPIHSSKCHIPVQQPATTTATAGNMTSNTSPNSTMDHRLEADVDDDNDLEEALLPMAHNRPGISDSKARDLYARYGLLYSQRNTCHEEPPAKLRRVERPIRMRVHWKCHACETMFGKETTCVECGHSKCAQCPRSPPKRVQEVIENGRHIMQQSEAPRQEVSVCSENECEKSSANSTLNHSAMASPTLARSPSIDVDLEVGHPSFDFTFGTRHTATVRMFAPDYHYDQCNQHPQSLRTDKWTHGSTMFHKMSRREIPMIKSAVRRVYRKPRQRVRYTCEHCSALLVDGDRCRECDRDVFLRSPPRRTPTQYDADVFQMVANRLAARGDGYDLPQGLTA